MLPGRVCRYNAAPAPNGSILGAQYFSSPDSNFQAALTPEAVLLDEFRLLLKVPYIPTLCHLLRAAPVCIPPLFNLALLAPLPMLHSRSTLAYKNHMYLPFAHFISSPPAPSPPHHFSGCSSIPPAFSFSPNWFRALQQKAGGF